MPTPSSVTSMTSPQTPVVTVILSAVACACRTVLLTASRTTARVCPANLPVLNEVPAEVVGHIRRDLRLPEGTMPICASTRTAERHRNLVRARGEVVYDPAGARKVAADAIEEAARRKNDPAVEDPEREERRKTPLGRIPLPRPGRNRRATPRHPPVSSLLLAQDPLMGGIGLTLAAPNDGPAFSGLRSAVRHAGPGLADHVTDGHSNLAGGDLRPW